MVRKLHLNESNSYSEVTYVLNQIKDYCCDYNSDLQVVSYGNGRGYSIVEPTGFILGYITEQDIIDIIDDAKVAAEENTPTTLYGRNLTDDQRASVYEEMYEHFIKSYVSDFIYPMVKVYR